MMGIRDLRNGRLKPFAQAISVSVLNQGVSSGTNFVMGLYLVRSLVPAEFGMYGIGFAVGLFYSGICNALFLTQMVVHTPEKAECDRRPYAARILFGLAFFSCAVALVVVVTCTGLSHCSDWFRKNEVLAFASTAAAIAYVLKDFFVRYSYTARKEVWALKVNCVVAVTLAIILAIQHYSAAVFSAERALFCYAISNMTGAVAGYFMASLPVRTVKVAQISADTREAWQGGRWAIGGVTVIWAQTQAYNYLTAFFLGPAGVGQANAARMLISPFVMLSPALNQVTMPRLAELRLKGGRRVYNIAFITTGSQISLAIVYLLVITLASKNVIPMMVGNHYRNLGPLVLAWSGVLLLQLLRDGAATLLQVLKHFRIITLLNMVSSIVVIVFTVVLMKSFGVVGAILGTALGEILLALLLWWVILRERDKAGRLGAVGEPKEIQLQTEP